MEIKSINFPNWTVPKYFIFVYLFHSSSYDFPSTYIIHALLRGKSRVALMSSLFFPTFFRGHRFSGTRENVSVIKTKMALMEGKHF